MKFKNINIKDIFNSMSGSPTSWKIPEVGLFISDFEEYPSKLVFNRVIDPSKLVNFFKNNNNTITNYIEGAGTIVKKDQSVYPTSVFFIIQNRDIAIKLSLAHVYDDDPTFQLEDEKIQNGKFFEFQITIYYSNSEYTREDIFQEYVMPIKALGREALNKKKLSIVIRDDRSFYLTPFNIEEPKIDFNLNYNKDFKIVDKVIKENLTENKQKGIVLLHGNPGTGKTMYIRHLINNINKEHIIYLPPDLTSSIANPDFAGFLLEYPNSLLIIEDAETAIRSRDRGDTNLSSVSNLLNMADGLLSDALKMQILATFNSNINDIDEALLRKGRLITKYEFKPLKATQAQKLSDSLGYKRKITESETLASIYNPEGEDEADKQKQQHSTRKVGF